MPTLVQESALSKFKPFSEHSSQEVTVGYYQDSRCFYKMPPKRLTNPKARALRILNEAFYGKVLELLNQELGNRFITPSYRLVVKDGYVTGVLCQEIPYDSLNNYGTSKENLLKVLKLSGFAEMAVIRFFIKDPDGCYNTGYGEGDKLSAIDPGLANFPYLKKQKALLSGEEDHVPSESDDEVFSLNPEKIFSGSLEDLYEVEFLLQHIFPDFARDMALLYDGAEKEVVTEFFKKRSQAYQLIARVLSKPEFKAKIVEELGIKELYWSEFEVFDELLDDFLKNGQILKTKLKELGRYTPLQFDQIKIANPSLTPVLRASSPHLHFSMRRHSINEYLQERVQDEQKRHKKENDSIEITGAHGGQDNAKILSAVVVPLSRTPTPVSRFWGTGEMTSDWRRSSSPVNVNVYNSPSISSKELKFWDQRPSSASFSQEELFKDLPIFTSDLSMTKKS